MISGISPALKVVSIHEEKPGDYVAVVEDPDGIRFLLRAGDTLRLNVKVDIAEMTWGGNP